MIWYCSIRPAGSTLWQREKRADQKLFVVSGEGWMPSFGRLVWRQNDPKNHAALFAIVFDAAVGVFGVMGDSFRQGIRVGLFLRAFLLASPRRWHDCRLCHSANNCRSFFWTEDWSIVVVGCPLLTLLLDRRRFMVDCSKLLR